MEYIKFQRKRAIYHNLVLLHQPFSDYYGAYHALETLYNEGKVRAIVINKFLYNCFYGIVRFEAFFITISMHHGLTVIVPLMQHF